MTAMDESVSGKIARTDINEATAARPTRRLRTRADQPAQVSLTALREELRAEVLQQELDRLVTTVELQRQTIESQTKSIDQLGTKLLDLTSMVSELGEIEREGLQDLLSRLDTGTAPTAPVEAATPETPVDEEVHDGIYVSDAFLDFLHVFGCHSRAVVNHAPLLNGLRTMYDDQGRFTLIIRNGGTLGTEFHMRDTRLILSAGDADSDDRPYVEGNYREGSRTVMLSDDQVDRILETLYRETNDFYYPAPKAAE